MEFTAQLYKCLFHSGAVQFWKPLFDYQTQSLCSICRPGHKILSKFQVQGQVAIFIFKTRTKKDKLKQESLFFKKVQARLLFVN